MSAPLNIFPKISVFVFVRPSTFNCTILIFLLESLSSGLPLLSYSSAVFSLLIWTLLLYLFYFFFVFCIFTFILRAALKRAVFADVASKFWDVWPSCCFCFVSCFHYKIRSVVTLNICIDKHYLQGRPREGTATPPPKKLHLQRTTTWPNQQCIGNIGVTGFSWCLTCGVTHMDSCRDFP